MLLHCGVRSVSKRACYLGVSVFQTIEEPVIAAVDRKHIASNSMNECMITTNVEEEYEKTIKALNTLQSNADTVRRSIANNTKQTPLQDTVKYLNRSGLSVEDLKKLSVIHVSGTKGKGSTCALTESILRNHGVKTGFFSSPHLVSVTERIRINGQPIAKQKFAQAFWRVFKRLEKCRQHETDMPPYFKFLTILCFHIFLEEKVDVTVVEVGIGGELDCTNVVSHTKTVGITSLGLEHTNLLGETLEAIAWQKAGIIKNNSNVYTSATQSECLRVIKERAAERNATLYIVPEFSQYMLNGKSCPQLQNLNNVIQLNGSLAIQLAYDWLRSNKNGYNTNIALNTPVITEKVIEGITNCSWPGRCEILALDNFKIHLDGAHTLESICLCSNWFNNVTKNSPNPKVLIFNATGERDSRRLLELLRQKIDITLACFVPNIASGSSNNSDNMSVFGIADQMKRAKLHASNWQLLCYESGEPDNGQVFGSILDSLCYVRQHFGVAQDLDVLVTGSLHLIGATMLALDVFKRRTEQTKALDIRV